MRAMYLTKNTGIWYAVTMMSLALVIGGLIALITGVLARRSKGRIFLKGISVYVSFSLFLILMDCARFAYLSEPDPDISLFSLNCLNFPGDCMPAWRRF